MATVDNPLQTPRSADSSAGASALAEGESRAERLPWPVAAARFVMVGGTCFGVNLVILWTATERWKWHYLLALALAWCVVFFIGFFLHCRWTFGASSLELWGAVRRYFMVNLGHTLVSTALLIALVSGLGLAPWLASVVNGVLLTGFTFVLHRNWSFAR